MYTASLLANQPNGDARPIFFCEYAHAMGNSGGNIKDFWDQWRNTKRIIGGCIWEFKDQALLKKDSAGVEYYAYGGDFGEKYFDNFTIKGVVNADGSPKGVMNECKRVFQTIQTELVDAKKGLIKITNRGAVKNTSAYNIILLIKEDGYVILTKDLPSLSIAPGKDSVISILEYLPAMKPDAEYHAAISFDLKHDESWAGEGFDIASNQFQLQKAQKNILSNNLNPELSYQQSLNGVTVRGKDFSIFINNTDGGGLSSYKYNGAEQIFQQLLPHFIRPLTDNDKRGWKPQRKLQQWYKAELKPGAIKVNKNSN
jgi:beta-galactosidase